MVQIPILARRTASPDGAGDGHELGQTGRPHEARNEGVLAGAAPEDENSHRIKGLVSIKPGLGPGALQVAFR